MNLDTKELFVLFCAVARMNNEFPGYSPASTLRHKLAEGIFKPSQFIGEAEHNKILRLAEEEMKEYGVPY